jgi:hypothetical protein
MSTFRAILLGTLVILALGAVTAAQAAVTYDAVTEWNGPYFRVITAPTLDQMVDDPVIDLPFVQPYSVAVKLHGSRKVAYVLDSGHNRVQAFEANLTYYSDVPDWDGTAPTAAGSFASDELKLNETVDAATNPYIIPHSEIVSVDGVIWTWVADSTATSFTAANKVYCVDYDKIGAANIAAPLIVFPTGALSATSIVTVRYALTDEQTGATAAFGLGDVDYGTGNGVTPVLTKIDETVASGPSSWTQVRSLSLIANEAAPTSDDIFLVDAADASENLFYYTVTNAGAVSFVEKYDDLVTTPYDAAVANGGPTEVAAACVVPAGTFTAGTVLDANQVTGHSYTVLDAAGLVTITDATTGRVLVTSTAHANLASPFLGIPGLSLTPAGASVPGTTTVTTTRAVVDRYLFVTDTGADRIKVISASDNAVTGTNDWLPSDAHTMIAQPAGAGLIGATQDADFRYTTPATVPVDYVVWTNAFPIKEGTLASITFDPAGVPVVWARIDDLATADPSDKVFSVDWVNGKITFGDGVHGQKPPNSTVFSFTYSVTPDVLHYGSSGTGPGRFSHPRGIAARWNALQGVYDVYVADAANNRIQKLAFHPADPGINLPARMDYICEWNTASTTVDMLNNPVDVAVAVDGSSPAVCYVAVADQGNSRLVIYNDTAAMTGGGSTPPTWDAGGGIRGNSLGLYMQIEGLALVANGNDLDIYTCDAQRGLVTKYEESPTPAVAFNPVDILALPDCFPPSGSLTFNFAVTNPPSGGWIDMYYDTSSTFDVTTAKLCVAAHTISPTATSATWNFATTPGGIPADRSLAEGGYYVFLRVKDSNGVTVASAVTSSTDLLCIDSSLLPGLKGLDRIDGDWTLYLQNGLSRSINLQVAYPESVVAVGFGGTFETSALEVTNIVPGTGWNGTSYINEIFNQGYSNTNGTFNVSTSVTGAPYGLNGGSGHTLAVMTVRALDDVLTPANRFRNSSLQILTASSNIKDKNGDAPTQWITRNVNLRYGYLGDLATSGTGADSALPHFAPKPDGKINFEDQMVFTLGWNGLNNVQDRIADIGPTEGTVPDLRPIPDGIWNVDDILAFTVMYSWAAGAGYYRPAPGQEPLVNRVPEARPQPLGGDVAGRVEAFTVSHVTMPKQGELMTVDLVVNGVYNLTGALLNLGFDPSQLELVTVENGGFLDGQSGSLFFDRSGSDWVEISATRLDQESPGVEGSGAVARVTFRILDPAARDLSLQYDLRSSTGAVLGRGSRQIGAFSGEAAGFQLYSASPNPVIGTTNIVFSLPRPVNVGLYLYDVGGRKVRSLVSGRQDSGYHVVSFDGNNDAGSPLPAGVYFYRLQANGKESTRKLILTR